MVCLREKSPAACAGQLEGLADFTKICTADDDAVDPQSRPGRLRLGDNYSELEVAVRRLGSLRGHRRRRNAGPRGPGPAQLHSSCTGFRTPGKGGLPGTAGGGWPCPAPHGGSSESSGTLMISRLPTQLTARSRSQNLRANRRARSSNDFARTFVRHSCSAEQRSAQIT
jgi:hypothetical protein